MNGPDKDSVPAGWVLATLGQVQLDLAQTVDPSRFPDERFELYSVPSYEHGLPELVTGKAIGSAKQTVDQNVVLLCKINPRINRVWVVGSQTGNRKIASSEWIPFFPLASLEPRFLAHFLRQNVVRDFLAGNASGVGGSLMRVRAATFRDFPFPLAPLPEQQRIGDTLDELLSDLDAGVAALERVRSKLKLYRAAVLKAAVEGALTAEWRKEHPEPASELLKHILAERRRRWEEDQLRKFKEKGREPPKGWKAKYKEPVAPGRTDLPPLPEGWCWTSLDALIVEGPQNGVYLPSTLYGRGVEILRIDDFQNGWIRPREDLKRVEANSDVIATYALHRRNLVINRVNSMTHLGKCCLVADGFSGVLFESNMMRLKIAATANARYVEYYLRSETGRHRLTKDAKWAVNQASINQEDVKRTPVPLPPLHEQDAIAEAVEDQLSIIDHVESDLAAKRNSAQALRQSIMRAAIAGKLVPQDPNDEPASELLKRITSEREQRLREAAAAKKLNDQVYRRARKSSGRIPRAKRGRKEQNHGRIANR